MTSWNDNKISRKLYLPPSSVRKVHLLPMSTNNYLMPLRNHSPPIYPEHNVNEKRIKQYELKKYPQKADEPLTKVQMEKNQKR